MDGEVSKMAPQVLWPPKMTTWGVFSWCIQFEKAKSEEWPADSWTYMSDTQGDARAQMRIFPGKSLFSLQGVLTLERPSRASVGLPETSHPAQCKACSGATRV